MTANSIINEIFHLYIDDSTEMSDSEELALLNRIYKKICQLRPWEFLKTPASGSISFDGTNYYITLPTDFGFFTENNQTDENDAPKVIFVGSNYSPYKIVNFSDRRQYRNSAGYAYLDLANSKIVFTGNPTSDGSTYEFDYIKVPVDLATGDEPIFRSDFHPIIGWGMCIDGFIIQLFDKARSYAAENQMKYNEGIKDMAYYNANLRVE